MFFIVASLAFAQDPAPTAAPAADPAVHTCACKDGADGKKVCACPPEGHASDATPHVCGCGRAAEGGAAAAPPPPPPSGEA
ncbi:MAG: hypothetical protein ACOZNI_15780, partial [Myxococcota bacterium]